MRPYLTCLASAAVLVASTNAVAQRDAVSMYTDISETACAKQADDESTGAYTMKCPGIHGFGLLVLEDDERSSVSVVAPDKRVFPLNFWDVVTHGFSTLGARAEWRVTKANGKITPIGIIVRVNALDQSDPEHPKRVALLAVAKISPNAACVTRVVESLAPNANKQARRFADDASTTCLPVESETQPSSKG